MLRQAFARDAAARWRDLGRVIRQSILERDCFGIIPDQLAALEHRPEPRPRLTPTPFRAFDFKRHPAKIEAFMAWLQEQEQAGVLQLIYRPGIREGVEAAWSDVYIDTAYRQSLRAKRAKVVAEAAKKGKKLLTVDEMPGGITWLLNQPIHADSVGAIYTRVFEELKTVTSITNQAIRRSVTEGLTAGLARGIAEGKGPRVIARELVRDVEHHVDKIGAYRARMIARTEVIRAHHLAGVTELERAQLEIGEKIMGEWLLGGAPCAICLELQAGGPYELADIKLMIPAHPHCVCGHAPVLTGIPLEQTAATRAIAI